MALSQLTLQLFNSLCGKLSPQFVGSGFSVPSQPTLVDKTVITNVTVWNGEKHISDRTIVIEGRNISLTGDTSGGSVIDGKGGFLMPGLIDAHVHADAKNGLQCLANYGITTGYDMGTPNANMSQWHDVGNQGLTSLLYSGGAACKESSFPCAAPGYPSDGFVTNNPGAIKFANNRIMEGSDYLKIVASDDDPPIPVEGCQEAIRKVADQNGKNIVTHATSYAAQRAARHVGGKFITHLPKEKALTQNDVREMIEKKQVAIPTLLMMQNVIKSSQEKNPKLNYTYCKGSLKMMYQMNVPILVGTDATPNVLPVVLVSYGESIHTELQLLQEAGVRTEDILKGATSLSAKHFGLTDRGIIAPGMRADLVLLDSDPFENLKNSDRIVQVWTAGTKLQGPFGRWADKYD